MVDRFEEQSQGVTFWHRGVTFFRSADKNKATLTLECDIEDLNLWNEIEKKFHEGFRVHASGNFHLDVMDAMRLHTIDVERALEEEKALHQRTQKALRLYESILDGFGVALK